MAENQVQVKVAACQLLTSEDVSANTTKVLQQIEACAEMDIQIAAFPEGCLFGYCCRTDYWEHISPQVFKEAEAEIAEAARADTRWLSSSVRHITMTRIGTTI